MTPYRSTLLAALVISLLPQAAAAQDDTGGLAGLAASAVFGESTDAAVTASMGFRVTGTVAITLELTSVPGLTPDVPDGPDVIILTPGVSIFPPPFREFTAEGGDATFFTANLRLDVPATGRMQPFLVAGAGAGSMVERIRYQVWYPEFPFITQGSAAPGVGLLPQIAVPASVGEVIETTSSGFAATFGGGLSVRLRPRLAVEVEARYLGLLGSRTRHLARVGGGLSVKF